MLRATAVAMVRPFVSSMPLEPNPQSSCLESVDGKYSPGGGMLIYDSTVRQLQLPAEQAKYLVARRSLDSKRYSRSDVLSHNTP